MTKSQIEEERARFELVFKNYNLTRYESTGNYAYEETCRLWQGWLAAKQDAETRSGLIQSYCTYCGTDSYEHLPNCKGARG